MQVGQRVVTLTSHRFIKHLDTCMQIYVKRDREDLMKTNVEAFVAPDKSCNRVSNDTHLRLLLCPDGFKRLYDYRPR